MQDLKLEEKMASSKEAISRTWTTSSSKVRGAVESAWAGFDQYRAQRKIAADPAEAEKGTNKETDEAAKKESFVGGWAAWAAEKRKKAFQKEEPPKVERVDIGPAPARPLAQWAKRSTDAASSSSSGGGAKGVGTESIRSSASETRVEARNEAAAGDGET